MKGGGGERATDEEEEKREEVGKEEKGYLSDPEGRLHKPHRLLH